MDNDNVFIGEIRIFAGTYAPRGWAFCWGQQMNISANTTLFTILGTNYGGDGVTTFGLPDLRGRVPVGVGQGPGLSNYELGEITGEEATTLLQINMPYHNHQVNALSSIGSTPAPAGNIFANKNRNDNGFTSSMPNATLGPMTIGVAGGSNPVSNLQPYMALNFIIALEGEYPQRN